MEEIRKPIGPDHIEVITSDGIRQIEISPSGSNINYLDEDNNWYECDPTKSVILTGESGRSRTVFPHLPLTVGVRSDNTSEDIVTLRLSSDKSKNTEISFTLVSIEDGGVLDTGELNENIINGKIVNKGNQVIDIVDNNTLRLLTPYKEGIQNRKVVYSVNVPNGYKIIQTDNNIEIHDQSGYLRTLRTTLLDADMQPVCDAEGMPLDAISLTVVAHGQDEEGRQLYTLTKQSKISLLTVDWEWFDVEVTSVNLAAETILKAANATWASVREATAGSSSSKGILAKCRVWSGAEQRYRWIGRGFLTFNLSAYSTTPSEIYLSTFCRISGDAVDGAFVIQKGTQNPTSTTTDLSWFPLFDNSSIYCQSSLSNLTTAVTMHKLDLTAFKNNGNYTTLCLRSANDYNNVEPATLDKWYGIEAAGDDGERPKLILVYAHSGPSKPLFFKDSLVLASGRIQFPLTINRDTPEGAAVLDGLQDVGGTFTSNFMANGLGVIINTPGRPATEVTINGSKGYQINHDVTGWERNFILPYYGDTNLDVSGTMYQAPEDIPIGNYGPYVRLEGPRNERAITLQWQPGTPGKFNLSAVTEVGTVVIGYHSFSSTQSYISSFRFTIIDNVLNAWVNGTKFVTDYNLVSQLSSIGWQSNTPLRPAIGSKQVCKWTLLRFDGTLTRCAPGRDLHFRKVDGSLIPAFSRSALLGPDGHTVNQIDCRLSINVEDLSGLTMAYDPDPSDTQGATANLSDFAVDSSQVTGTTIAEAEADPLPGTFWDYYPIGVTSLTGGFFWGFG